MKWKSSSGAFSITRMKLKPIRLWTFKERFYAKNICKKYLGAYCFLLLSCYRKTAKGLFFIKLLCFSKTSPLSQTPLQNLSSISLERTYQILMHSKTGMKKLQWSFFYNPYEVKTNIKVQSLTGFNFIRAIEKAPLELFHFIFCVRWIFIYFSFTILKTNFVEAFDLKVRFLKSIKVLWKTALWLFFYSKKEVENNKPPNIFCRYFLHKIFL